MEPGHSPGSRIKKERGANMKTWMKALVCVVLSFSFFCICLGYAAITDTLSLTGSAKVDIPAGVYIIELEESSSAYLDKKETTFVSYSTTVASVMSRHQDSSRQRPATVTYRVKVLNNTEYAYSYRDIYFQQDLYNNNSINIGGNSAITISCTLDNETAANKIIKPGETKEFYVTYTLGRNLDKSADYRTLINIRFGINVDSLEQAHNALMEKFAEILNSASSYAELYDKINDKFDGNQEWTSNFIGNVDGSSTADSVTMNGLFGGRLQMVIGDEEKTVTALIKHEPVDGSDSTGDSYTITYNNGSQQTRVGCEYTIYLTTATLNSWSFNTYPEVYAAVFTCQQNEDGSPGEWYMKGQLYQGTARVVGYMGEESGGSFDTGTWRSTAKEYVLSENYSFTLNAGMTIQEVTQLVDDDAPRILAALLTEAKAILDGDKYAGTGVEELQRVYDEAKPFFTVADDGTIVVDGNHALADLVEHIDSLVNALKAFENVP